MMQISQGTIGSPWHQVYHSSSSTSDLSSYEHGYLRRSPDQYSSRGSMESLDHTSHTYHSYHYLSPAKSTNCIDQLAHLHNKRDSAYSSFSTNSSIPEYHPTSFSKERSYSMESMHSRNNVQEGIKHADIRYIKTVYDAQRGVSEEYEVNSSSVKNRNFNRLTNSNRNSGGPPGRLEQSRVFSESDCLERGAPMPPTRSDSYAVTRHHERPSSWSSIDQNRCLRTLPKATGSHPVSGTSNLSQQLKPTFGDGQLHTVLEKSPESSPLIKPKQICPQAPQPGQPMLPTGIYPVPSPEPHFAHAPLPPKNNSGSLYPALAKEGAYSSTPSVFVEKPEPTPQCDNKGKDYKFLQTRTTKLQPTNHTNKDKEKKQEGASNFAPYKLHFSMGSETCTSCPKSEKDTNVSQTNHYVCNSDQQIKAGVKIATKNQTSTRVEKGRKCEVQGFHIPVESETVGSIQNHRDEIKAKHEISPTPVNTKTYGIQSGTDTLEDKRWGNTSTSNGKAHDKPHQQDSDHRNKLDSPSFTKLIDDIDSSVMLYNKNVKPEEPVSPSQNKICDFTRRRLSSSSTQSTHSVQYGKGEVNKPRSSVLEKISMIEQREQESQRSQVTAGNHYTHPTGQANRSSNNRGSVNSIEEIRNRFNSQEHNLCSEKRRLSSSHSTEKDTGAQQLKRAGSVYSMRAGESQKQVVASQVDKTQQYNHEHYVLQAMPADNKRTVDTQTMPNKDDHWQSSQQDTLGFNRSYRNSIKDAQSKVLEATSFRRKDLEISPPQYQKQGKNVKRPTSAVLYSKTSPVSPHVPKERHSITPTDSCAKVQDIPSQGVSYPVTRIGPRRRLTAEQKKRSYSEPEKMNEVGATENESSRNVQKKGQNVSFLENTVADRRRIFERDGKACSTVNLSKPELKQLQQNALADYIERKTGRRPSSQEGGLLKERSQSSYFSGSIMDNQSISSTSSMNSLQEHLPGHAWDIRNTISKTGRVSSTLPPGLSGIFDLDSFEQDTDHHISRTRSSSFAHHRLLDYRTKTEPSMSPQVTKHTEFTSSTAVDYKKSIGERKSGKSASAEDLIDTLQQTVTHHVRSRSSPADDKKSRDLMSRQDVNVKSTSYGSYQGFSVLKSRSGVKTDKGSFRSTLESHQDNGGGTGEKNLPPTSSIAIQNTAYMNAKNQVIPQSLKPEFGIPSHLHEYKSITVPLPSQPNPSKTVEVSTTHCIPDFAEECLYNRKRVVDKEASPMHDHKSYEHSTEKVSIKKATPPQRPPPPKIKCTKFTSEQQFPQEKTPSPTFGNKLSPRWNSNSMWSSSSSEPEASSHYGKISLRISESCLQSSSPFVGQDEEDDEVFMKEPEVDAFYRDPAIPPSPPHFAPPTIDDALLNESTKPQPNPSPGMYESKDTLSNSVKDEDKERSSVVIEEMAIAPQSMITTRTPIKNYEQPLERPFSAAQEPQPTPDSGVVTHNYAEHSTPHKDMVSSASQRLEMEYLPCENRSTLTSFQTDIMSPEDVKTQELAKEIVDKDKSLADILDPESKMKTTMDLMSGLFTKSSRELKDNNRKWKEDKSAQDMVASVENGKKEERKETSENTDRSFAYYAISAPKAELLKKSKQMLEAAGTEDFDVNEKKAELITSLTHKLEVLQDAKESLQVDIKLNNKLGEEVEALIESLCKPNEFDKYKMFIGDLDKVVNLLLSLSGRLARVENVLSNLSEDTGAAEMKIWNEKKKQLSGQHEDARELKDNLDRREKLVMDILGNYLTGEQFQEYQHFVKMKSALLIEQRELDDKIKLGQDQLRCLLESLPSDFQIRGKVPSKEVASPLRQMNLPPPLTSSL
ncbi:protein Shroom3 isoform X2 [Spea bombifrons]|nr:protein Shroom3 isoform X2 [Spea bombifrons]